MTREISKEITLGSLFDGAGGFPYAGILTGIRTIWASEIEPFPIRVTTKRMPSVKHYGDVSTLDGAKLEPVDIITFSSPCQDLSISGKRAGLDGSRSSLFYEAIRIIKEMRKATNGRKPEFIVWENVPGAFSSNHGEDFRCIIENICSVKDENVSIPRPKKWNKAGCVVGDGYSVAWRVLDAQYWGVPQRRKRIYLVADFGGERAGKILFESESVSWNSCKGRETWKKTAGDIGESSQTTGWYLNDQGGDRMSASEDVVGTLRAQEHGHQPFVFENHSNDSRYKGPLSTANTVTARYGTGGNNQPLVVETPKTLKIRCGCEGGGKGALIQNNKSATLATNNNDQTLFQPVAHGGASESTADTVVAVQGSIIGRKDKNGPQGSGIGENVSFTLNTTDRHAVAFSQDVYSTSKNSYHTKAEKNLVSTLTATDYKDPPTVLKGSEYIIRRLIPLECARLQGYPDYWCDDLGTDEPTDEEMAFWRDVFETHRRLVTHAKKPKSDNQIRKWLKNPYSDSAEYKMWGNSIAIPCALYVLHGISKMVKNN